MQFLPENKNKRIVLVVVLVAALGCIAYINFFMGKSRSPSANVGNADLNLAQNKAVNQQSFAGNKTPPPPAKKIIVKRAKPGLLPFGSEIDVTILDTEKFKALKASPKLIVKPEELGKSDIFRK